MGVSERIDQKMEVGKLNKKGWKIEDYIIMEKTPLLGF